MFVALFYFMEPKIVTKTAFLLAGIYEDMSLSNDLTFKLWRSFMPIKMRIATLKDKDNYCVKVHRSINDINHFTPDTLFTKWAAVAIDYVAEVPDQFHLLEIPEGLYAVFTHKGPASTFNNTLEYIFINWLPNSKYMLRDAPHFEVLKNDYNPEDPLAEEAVWIPIQEKK